MGVIPHEGAHCDGRLQTLPMLLTHTVRAILLPEFVVDYPLHGNLLVGRKKDTNVALEVQFQEG